MVKRKTKLNAKIKKKWFMAVAPEVYRNIELAEIAAFEPKNLIGRAVEITLAKITGTAKDQHKKLHLKIKDTRGEKAITEPWKLFLQESYVQRASRRFKEHIISVFKIKTKDNKTAKLKLLILVFKKLPRAIRTELAKKTEQIVTERLSNAKSSDLFAPMALEKLTAELRKELKIIYPVNRVIAWKLTVD